MTGAGSAAHILSLCRTHHDDPARTKAFLAAVRDGRVRITLPAGAAVPRHALAVLGIGPALIQEPGPWSRRSLRSLRPPFWRGRLHGQIESVYRDREADPERVRQFQSAVAAGLISLAEIPNLPPHLVAALAKLGIVLPNATDC